MLICNQSKATGYSAAAFAGNFKCKGLPGFAGFYLIINSLDFGHRIVTVVIARRLWLVQIITGRQNRLKAMTDCIAYRVWPLPGLNNNIFRQIRMLDFILADHFSLML